MQTSCHTRGANFKVSADEISDMSQARLCALPRRTRRTGPAIRIFLNDGRRRLDGGDFAAVMDKANRDIAKGKRDAKYRRLNGTG